MDNIRDSDLRAKLAALSAAANDEARLKASWELVESLRPLIIAEARKLGPAFADDAAQECALMVRRSAAEGRFGGAALDSPRAYLRIVIRHLLFDARRAELRHFRRRESEEAIPPPPPQIEAEEEVAAWRSWPLGPIEGFVLMASVAPELVEREDVERAVGASNPPRRHGLVRDAESTWRLFERYRARAPRLPRDLCFALRSAEPASREPRWSKADADRARNWVDQQVHHARQALRPRPKRAPRAPRFRRRGQE